MSKALSLYINTALFVCIASLCIASKPKVSYDEVRADFKQQLFKSQQNIMTEEGYMGFIEPYIKEAEAKLIIPQYLMDNPNCGGCAHYFTCLLNYSVAYFNAYAKTYSTAKAAADKAEVELALSIERIKAEASLDLDVAQELTKTKNVFERANRRFYKKLGLGARIFNFFRTLGK